MPEGKVFHGDEYQGEWKFVDEDWGGWTPEQRKGRWLRTWEGVRQVLQWIPASNQDDAPASRPTDD